MNRRPMILVSIAVVAAMLVTGLVGWVRLPADAQVPIHWGPSGQIDGYADKLSGLFLLPVVTAVLATLLAVIPSIEPRRRNLERSGKAYGAVWIGVMVLLGAIQLMVVAVAPIATVSTWVTSTAAMGALFVVIGNYLPKVRPNYLMGIRTPWTLASDLAWTRTHRVGGRLFVVGGLLLLALGILGVPPEVLDITLVGEIAILLVVVLVYSYRVWRTDPARRTT